MEFKSLLETYFGVCITDNTLPKQVFTLTKDTHFVKFSDLKETFKKKKEENWLTLGILCKKTFETFSEVPSCCAIWCMSHLHYKIALLLGEEVYKKYSHLSLGTVVALANPIVYVSDNSEKLLLEIPKLANFFPLGHSADSSFCRRKSDTGAPCNELSVRGSRYCDAHAKLCLQAIRLRRQTLNICPSSQLDYSQGSINLTKEGIFNYHGRYLSFAEKKISRSAATPVERPLGLLSYEHALKQSRHGARQFYGQECDDFQNFVFSQDHLAIVRDLGLCPYTGRDKKSLEAQLSFDDKNETVKTLLTGDKFHRLVKLVKCERLPESKRIKGPFNHVHYNELLAQNRKKVSSMTPSHSKVETLRSRRSRSRSASQRIRSRQYSFACSPTTSLAPGASGGIQGLQKKKCSAPVPHALNLDEILTLQSPHEGYFKDSMAE
ncbi:uncharacterized protein LOC135145594 [Zophobas morio]|uniref:uncharacterized protein LOC135145594 n=1 Tax=Zophobas morio TaxID=2755281 RepID=UPI00308350AB